MRISNYYQDKCKFAYNLFKSNRFFRKARAVMFHDGKLCLNKVIWNDGRPDEYIFPGGGVDDGESPKQAAMREAFEEYGATVNVSKFLGKKFYKHPMEYNNESFISKRVEYYYFCDVISIDENQFGLDGEFDFDDRKIEKVKLTLKEVMALDYKKFKNISEMNYNRIIEYMKHLVLNKESL